MKKGADSEKLEKFKSICKKNRLKVTVQRIAIYNAVMNDRSHPTVNDVYKKINKTHPNISFDTVYRTLIKLSSIGLIKINEDFKRQQRFDPDISEHHHLYCRNCGKIYDFNNAEYDRLEIPENIKKKFKILGKRVVIEVLCENCTKNAKEVKNA